MESSGNKNNNTTKPTKNEHNNTTKPTKNQHNNNKNKSFTFDLLRRFVMRFQVEKKIDLGFEFPPTDDALESIAIF
jgi:hypothetical protein